MSGRPFILQYLKSCENCTHFTGKPRGKFFECDIPEGFPPKIQLVSRIGSCYRFERINNQSEICLKLKTDGEKE